MGIQCWNVGVMIDTIVFFDGVLVGDSTAGQNFLKAVVGLVLMRRTDRFLK